MRTLSLDLETYSPVNLASSGVYRYAEDSHFEILLFGYSIDGEPAHVIDLAQGETIPTDLLNALSDPTVTKSAFNAAFERVCLSFYLRRHYPKILAEGFLDPRSWRCTMVWAASLGLPMSLDGAAKALRLPVEKDPTGKRLIRKFSIPGKDGSRVLPMDDLVGWQQYISYNRRDVDVEVQLAARLARNPMPQAEWETYWLDQRMNDTGVRIDTQLAMNAVQIDTRHREDCLTQARQITGLENPNSPIQLKDWLNAHGCSIASLTKAEVEAALETATGDTARVLRLRQDLSKSSVKKYLAMLAVAGSDHRARGLIQYMGAGRTGRFAGRLVQVQNLPRNIMPDLTHARAVLHEGDREVFELLYSPISDTLSQLIRTAFIPSEGHRFIVADFSAIEARVLAWLAGEEGTLHAFRAGKDLYCQTASRMFGVPVEKHGANSELRQKGKIAVLACGYGGSVGALKAMGALRMGLDEAELKPLVDAWREANQMVVQFWHDVEQAAITTIQTRTIQSVGRVRFSYRSGCLFICLPSGRELCYPRPRLGENRFGMISIIFDGIDGTSRKWGAIETYGGKITENIVQATARDLLTYSMNQVDTAGHQIVMHVHDEIIVDEPESGASVDEIVALMTQLPQWADGLPLDADGYACNFYMKD